MGEILACRVLSSELEHLFPNRSFDYFEPLCHRMREREFVDYVDSLLLDHTKLICGNCGGLTDIAESRGKSIPSAEDCIDLLLCGMVREPKTLYLFDGWLENLDLIFGMDRLPVEARRSVLKAIFSSIRKIVYISTNASKRLEEGARELADLLGCEFSSLEGSLSMILMALED
jgi:hypothetical protein